MSDQETQSAEVKKVRDAGFIADLSYDRGAVHPVGYRFKKIGKLFFDFDHTKPSILLAGFRFGKITGFPYDGCADRAPYLEGDIVIPIPAGRNSGELWIGFVYTDQSATGRTSYNIVLEVDPWPLVVARRVRQLEHKIRDNSDAHTTNGLWLYVKGMDGKDDTRKEAEVSPVQA
jgi:hypothetical protein